MLTNNKAEVSKSKENNNLRIAIVASRYYDGLIDNMVKGCVEFLVKSGVKKENIDIFYVPGSWEIPVVAQKVAHSQKYDGIVTFGIIVKGETYHYKILADQVSRTLMNVMLESNLPIAFEILVVENIKQAHDRTNGKANKGLEAARAVLETIKTLNSIK